MRFSKTDTETVINWNMADNVAYIHTRMPNVMRHMEQVLGVKPTTTHRDNNDRIYGKDYEVPKGFIRLPRRNRQVSAEQREKMAARLAEVRARKPSQTLV